MSVIVLGQEPGQFEDFKASHFSSIDLQRVSKRKSVCLRFLAALRWWGECLCLCVIDWMEEGARGEHFGLVFLVKPLTLNKISFWYNALLTLRSQVYMITRPSKNTPTYWQSQIPSKLAGPDGSVCATCDCCMLHRNEIDGCCPWQFAALMNSEITVILCVCVCVCVSAELNSLLKSPVNTVSMKGFRLRAFCNTTCTHSLLPLLFPPDLHCWLQMEMKLTSILKLSRALVDLWFDLFNLWKQKCRDFLRCFQDPLGDVVLLSKIWMS